MNLIERVARTWASMDGKLGAYDRDKTLDSDDPDYGGYDEGYHSDATELLRRAGVIKMVKALEFYADVSKYPAPLTGGMGELWSDCGEIARDALRRG